MRAEERAAARRQLDKRLNSLRNSEMVARPSRGWVRAIREALGMTTAQLGKRIGVSQPRAVAVEKAEAEGSITLDSLERAARALDCRLVYALVPRDPLKEMVHARAQRLALKRLESTRHSMSLEAQEVEETDEQEQVKRMIAHILDKSGSQLWEEE